MQQWMFWTLLCVVACASVTALALSTYLMVKKSPIHNTVLAARVSVDTTAFTAFSGTALDGITLNNADRVLVVAVAEPTDKVSDSIGVYQFKDGTLNRCAIEKGTLIVITDGTKSGAWYHVLADTDIAVVSGVLLPSPA